ncbi:MAG: hypothetical protein ACR2PL_24070 [Dehalococcoidia bacterium]
MTAKRRPVPKPAPSRDLGSRLQAGLDGIELAARRQPAGGLLLGVGLALIVVLGGIVAFIVVWAILVGIVHH